MSSHLVRVSFVLTLLAMLAVTAGCGGTTNRAGSGLGTGAAGLVPASAIAFVSIDTDANSFQWKSAKAFLGRFPSHGQLLSTLAAQLSKQGLSYGKDIEPALGGEVDIALLAAGASGGPQVALLTQPPDKSKLTALVDKNAGSAKPVIGDVGGWTAVTQTQDTLAQLKQTTSASSLAGQSAFSSAMAGLGSGALLKVYASGKGLRDLAGSILGSGALGKLGASAGGLTTGGPGPSRLGTLAAAITPGTNSLRLDLTSGGVGTSAAFASHLLDTIPAGSIAYASFANLGSGVRQVTKSPQLAPYLRLLQQKLGLRLDELAALVGGEGALYVRPGTPVPEVGLEFQEPTHAAATAGADRLAASIAALSHGKLSTLSTTAGPARAIALGSLTLFVGGVGDRLVVTDAQTAFTDLSGNGPKLRDAPTFKDALKAAGVPAETQGLLYVDLDQSVQLLESLARIGGTTIPIQVRDNLAPLRAFVLYSAPSGAGDRVTALLQTN